MKHLHLLYTLLFGVAVLLFFGLAYPHHLHYQEQYQLFLFDNTYVWEMIKFPGGIADLLGRFCTQFFLYAWVGALIIAILLSIVQILTLRLANWGRLYGLSFVPSFLLWLFMLDEDALLGGVWAVLLTLLASWVFDKVAKERENNPSRVGSNKPGWSRLKVKLPYRWIRPILLVAAIPILYWMVGPICLLFFLIQIPLVKNNNTQPKRSAWYYGVFVLLAIMPILLSYYVPVQSGRLWTGIHYHRYPTEIPVLLWCSALSIFVLILIVRTFHNWVVASSRFVVSLISFALVSIIMGFFVWKNSNFKAEKVMQYDFMACHQQWNRILETISADKPNNQIGVTVQNLALAMRGQLVDHMFEYNQNGILGLLPDVGTDATSPMPTAEAFYQLGMVTIAQRTVFEAQEAILDFQKSARCYKRLAQTNLILGNYEVARKYLMALQKTLFYRDWANETLSLLGNEKAIDSHPEYGRLRKLQYNKNFFFGDHVTPYMLESLFFSNTSNRLAYEYLMAYYLLTGDLENFANFIGWGKDLGYSSIPRHFQEAMILRWSLNHEKNELIPAQVSPAIVQRFKQFISDLNSPAMSREGLAQNFGDTYWYCYLNFIK